MPEYVCYVVVRVSARSTREAEDRVGRLLDSGRERMRFWSKCLFSEESSTMRVD